MSTPVGALVFPSTLKYSPFEHQNSSYVSRRRSKKKNQSFSPVARLFRPAIFEASKLKVLFLGADEEKQPGKLPRTYTFTHSDITSKLTLAISQTINNSQFQGWYHRLQRDEVIAEWKKVRGKMSLHVHCHISGGHFLLDFFAGLRYFIFCKELPVVLKAFVHGDRNLFNNYPELQEALVWVYFHSNIPEFNRMECWGPLTEAVEQSNKDGRSEAKKKESLISNWELPESCQETCNCCFPPMNLIPWSQKLPHQNENHGTHKQQREGLHQHQI